MFLLSKWQVTRVSNFPRQFLEAPNVANRKHTRLTTPSPPCFYQKAQEMPLNNVLSHFSCVRLFVTPWTVARQGPLSMGFSRQEYWSGLPFPFLHEDSFGIFPTQGSNPHVLHLLHWQAGSLPLAPPGKPMLSKGVRREYYSQFIMFNSHKSSSEAS